MPNKLFGARARVSLLAAGAAVAMLCAGSAQAQVAPATGDITPFYGTISPFYGNISPFYGNISPFYGNINPFWGTISPFYGTINPFYGNISPFYGTISPFTGSSDPFWGSSARSTGIAPAYSNIGDYWQNFGQFWKQTQPLWSDPSGASALGGQLNQMIATTESVWGATLLAATGKSFRDGVGQQLFARYGIDPNNGASLHRLTDAQRNQFLLDWYDTLMGYSGRDRIDHWMGTVGWTPTITQQQGAGGSSLIGILDARLTDDPDIANNIVFQGGSTALVSGHGMGVASLIVGAHDGRGVMGIAPRASIATYNPFDATNTANWQDLATGVATLANRGASIINMSLGVSGFTLSPDSRRMLFDPAVVAATRGRTVFVLSAGNDGVSQTANVAFDWTNNPALIVVGSVDVGGNISSFSNRPGSACLTTTASSACVEQLANRFMVAPGELILVSDGAGGVVRRSGTSFAAPLVSGAITLLHDRWPWLARYPVETVDIILRSARDLGAPGVDPVYGRGLLDVAASQSPLSFNNLQFYEVRNGIAVARSVEQVRSGGIKPTWEAENAFFVLFEPIGATQRDFAVPMSSRLVGSISINGGNAEKFQHFISGRMVDWIKGGSGFTDLATTAFATPQGWQMSFSGGVSPVTGLGGLGIGGSPASSVRVSDPSGRFALAFGNGHGALALNSQVGFGLTDDYGASGGVNPLVGFASGGAFIKADVALSNRTSLSLGATRQSLDPQDNIAFSETERHSLRSLDAYDASAATIRISHRLSERLTVQASYARLRESNGLLGVQSSAQEDLRHGSTSQTLTLGASMQLPAGLTLAGSATAGRTRTGGSDQGFRTAGDGVLSSAYALALTKDGVLGKSDKLRLSLAQPLHIESGTLAYKSVEVTDRETGAVGAVERSLDISNKDRRFTGELLYAAPLADGAEGSLFGRVNLKTGAEGRVDDFVIGGRLRLGF